MAFKRCSTVQTRFQQIEVWRTAACCEFRVAGAVHAWWHRDRYLTGLAWDNLAAAALLRPDGPPESVLMLGLAGGTALRVLRRLLPECRFTAVDIDREVVDLASREMKLDQLGVEVHFADAYEWSASHSGRYDVVIDDCYLAGEEDVYRPEKTPRRGIEVLSRLLAPGGVFLTNLVTGAGHRRVQSRTRTAFKRTFTEVRSVTTPESMNETLVGGGQVLTGGKLGDWTTGFSAKKDRDYWSRIRVAKLK